MGAPRFDWDAIPLAYAMDTLTMPVGWDDLEAPMAVNVGNPHVVFFVPDCRAVSNSTGSARRSSMIRCSRSASTSTSPPSPARERIRLRVWERGVGETRACGTGACATAVAAMRRGLVDRTGHRHPARRRPDNRMAARTARILMTGPAAESFRGTFDWRRLRVSAGVTPQSHLARLPAEPVGKRADARAAGGRGRSGGDQHLRGHGRGRAPDPPGDPPRAPRAAPTRGCW